MANVLISEVSSNFFLLSMGGRGTAFIVGPSDTVVQIRRGENFKNVMHLVTLFFVVFLLVIAVCGEEIGLYTLSW